MRPTRSLTTVLVSLLSAVGMLAAVPTPAAAECGGPDSWPAFRDGAASAPVVVAGTVRDVRGGARRDLPIHRFRLDVTEVLRGSAPRSLTFPGIHTNRGCIDWGLRVRDGDRIVVAFGPARSGIRGPVASVAFLSPIRDGTVMPGMQRLSMAHIRQILSLPSADGVFFAADDGTHGRELWRTDVRTGQTRLVRDIRAAGGSDPSSLTAAGGRLWFSADDGIHGRELWVTDGTPIGTSLVVDLRPGRAGSNPRAIAADRSGVVFSADDGRHGRELWRWEPDRARARLLADIRPGRHARPGSDPRDILVASGRVWFSADDGTHGRELWSVVPEARRAGPRLLDLDPGPASSDPLDGIEAWPGSFLGRVAFSADVVATGREPVGAAEGAAGVIDLRPGPASSEPGPFATTPRSLLFLADDGTGRQLWAMDRPQVTRTVGIVGSDPIEVRAAADTAVRPLTAFHSDPDSSTIAFADPARLDRTRAVFGASDAADGGQLYVTDGTAEGTVRLTDVAGGLGPTAIVGHGGRAWITVTGTGAAGVELWFTDGTAAGTRPIRDLDPQGDARPHDLVGQHGAVVFAATDTRHGTEPWVSDGTAGGTRRVADIRPGSLGSDPRELTAVTWARQAWEDPDPR